jgi:alditol oxidase
MKKRVFLKMSSVLVAGAAISPISGCLSPQKPRLKNWAGNIEYSTDNVHYPKSLDEVKSIVKKCKKLRALGSKHSFNRVADSIDNQISLEHLNKVISLDEMNHTVTVEGGIKYGELAPYLHQRGYALQNLASLPHITVAGAVTTATHGSGVKVGNLATAVSGIEFIDAEGEEIQLTRKDNREEFNGAVVAIGGMGIVTKLTLDLLPSFEMTQVVYMNLPMQALEKNMLTVLSSGYSVSLFTNWANRNISEVWLKDRAENGAKRTILPEFYGAKAATENVHPVIAQSAETVTDQMGIQGPWYERMPHFKMGFKPSTGKELQSEYFVGIEHAYEAMMAIEKLHEKITPHLFITEIRTVKADDLWMSPCYKKDSVAFHFTWKQEIQEVNAIIPLIEQALAKFNPRPHWAKIFTMSPTVLRSRIEKLEDFKELLLKYDPNGKFRNEFMNKNLYG